MRLAKLMVFASGVAWRRYVRPEVSSVTAMRGGPPTGALPDGAAHGTQRRPPAGWRPVPGRVLHLVTNALPERNAGYTVRTHRIVRAQQAAGLDPHVVTRLGFPVAQGHLDARPLRLLDGVPYHRLIPWWPPRDAAARLTKNIELAEALARRLRPSVLHAASNHDNAEVALALRERLGLPVVYEVRGFLEESWLTHDPTRRADDPYYLAERAAETACLRACDLVVTLGEAMREEIAARGIPTEKILIVPNAVDPIFLGPRPDAGVLRERLGIPAGAFVVGTTSTFYRFEGLDVLVEAVAEMRRHGVAAWLLLVGDGPERATLRRQVAAAGIADVTRFTGRVPASQVPRHHALLDVFVVPRRDERVCRLVPPLKPVEAMASGLPVVASDVTALREIVDAGVTGELVPPENPAALAKCLGELSYASRRRQEMGEAARASITANRTWAANAARYKEAYGKLGAG